MRHANSNSNQHHYDRSRQDHYEDEARLGNYQTENHPYPHAIASPYHQQNVIFEQQNRRVTQQQMQSSGYMNGMPQYQEEVMQYNFQMNQNGFNKTGHINGNNIMNPQMTYGHRQTLPFEDEQDNIRFREERNGHRYSELYEESYAPRSSTPSGMMTSTERTRGTRAHTSTSRSTSGYGSSMVSSSSDSDTDDSNWEDNIFSALNDMAGNLKKMGGIHCNQAGPDTTEVQLKINLPLPIHSLDAVAKDAMATLSPKKCSNMQYDNNFDMEEQFLGAMDKLQGNMMPVYKSLFESQSDSSSFEDDDDDQSESTYEDPRFLPTNANIQQQQQQLQQQQLQQQQLQQKHVNMAIPKNNDGVPSQIVISDLPSAVSSSDSWMLLSPRDRSDDIMKTINNNLDAAARDSRLMSDQHNGAHGQNSQWVPATKQKLVVENQENIETEERAYGDAKPMKAGQEKANTKSNIGIPQMIDTVQNGQNIPECYSDLTVDFRKSSKSGKDKTTSNVPTVKTQFTGDEILGRDKALFQRNGAKKASIDAPEVMFEEGGEMTAEILGPDDEPLRSNMDAPGVAAENGREEESEEERKQMEAWEHKAVKLEEERKRLEEETRAAEEAEAERMIEEQRKQQEAEEKARLEADAKRRAEEERHEQEMEEKREEEERKRQIEAEERLEEEKKRIEAGEKAKEAKRLEEERERMEAKAKAARLKLVEERKKMEAEARKKYEEEKKRQDAEAKAKEEALELQNFEDERKRMEAKAKAEELVARREAKEKERFEIENKDDASDRASLYKMQGFDDYCKGLSDNNRVDTIDHGTTVRKKSPLSDNDMADADYDGFDEIQASLCDEPEIVSEDSSSSHESRSLSSGEEEESLRSRSSDDRSTPSHSTHASMSDEESDMFSDESSFVEDSDEDSASRSEYSETDSVPELMTKNTCTRSVNFAKPHAQQGGAKDGAIRGKKSLFSSSSSYASEMPIAIAATMSTLRTFDLGSVHSAQRSLGRFLPCDESVVSTTSYSQQTVMSAKPIPTSGAASRLQKKKADEEVGLRSSILGSTISLLVRLMFSIIVFVFMWTKHLLTILWRKRRAKIDCTPTKFALQPDQSIRREEIQDRSMDNFIHRANTRRHGRSPYLLHEEPHREHYTTTMVMKPTASSAYLPDDSDEVGTCAESIVPETHCPSTSDGKMTPWKINPASTELSSLSSPPSSSFRLLRKAYSTLSSKKVGEKSNWIDHETIDDEMSYYD